MASVNKVIIIGNLGQDPDVRQFQNGGSVTSISVATSDRWTDKNTGEQKEQTEWHRVSLFNRLGEIAAQYLRKGSSVYIEGSLHTRKYTDQQGIERYSTEIRATQMQMLGGRNSANDGGYDGGYTNNRSFNQPANHMQNNAQSGFGHQNYGNQNFAQNQGFSGGNFGNQPQNGFTNHQHQNFGQQSYQNSTPQNPIPHNNMMSDMSGNQFANHSPASAPVAPTSAPKAVTPPAPQEDDIPF